MIKTNICRLKRIAKKHWEKWRNSITRDSRYLKRASKIKGDVDLILVVGAESTATRFISKILVTHELIIGEENPHLHHDLFDAVWKGIDEGMSVQKLREIFPKKEDGFFYLTRRSVPHALIPGSPAESFEFPPLVEFVQLAKVQSFNPLFLVTVRSPLPNILSWKEQRASAKGSMKKALEQYQDVYPYIFDAIQKTGSTYFIVPQEALLLDGALFVQSLFSLLGINSPRVSEIPSIKQDVNKKYYSYLTDL